MRFLDACCEALGAAHVLREAHETAPYMVDWSGRFRGEALAVLRPADAGQVARIVQLCGNAGVAIVPQGGNTGLCGGAVPVPGQPSVVLHLGRMNRLRHLDTANNSMTVDAGMTLAEVQRLAREAHRLFPLSLAAEGSCTIGGNLATNAGGIAVLRYGTARELCLGLEVVTATGEVWSGLRGLRKDNTGYNLRDLFIGSEGTLGVITGAVLKLFPLPSNKVAWAVGVSRLERVMALYEVAQTCLGARLAAFEVMSRSALAAVERHGGEVRLPPGASGPWFVLGEVQGSEDERQLREQLQALLASELTADEAAAATVSFALSQAAALWAVREAVPLAQKQQGVARRYDLSLPISAICDFVAACEDRLPTLAPDLYTVIFGHVGDGNLHFNVRTETADAATRLQRIGPAIDSLVYGLLQAHGGSISAEHGIGQDKLRQLPQHKSEIEMNLMRAIKTALDPRGLMNPGKVMAASRPPHAA